MNKIRFHRDSGSPLHHQIYQVLSDGISNGRYAVGEALPTEAEMTQMFGVSRITVRRAVASLRADSLVDSGAGRRTTVKLRLGLPLIAEAASMVENIAAFAAETVASVFEFEYVSVPGFLRDKLWQATAQPVQRTVRVKRRHKESEPAAHLTSYVPGTLGRAFTAADLGRSSMFDLLGRAGAHVTSAEMTVSAVLADPIVASRLQIKVGAPLLEIRSFMLDQTGRAVEYLEMLTIPSEIKLRIRSDGDAFLKPASKSAAARRPKKQRRSDRIVQDPEEVSS